MRATTVKSCTGLGRDVRIHYGGWSISCTAPHYMPRTPMLQYFRDPKRRKSSSIHRMMFPVQLKLAEI